MKKEYDFSKWKPLSEKTEHKKAAIYEVRIFIDKVALPIPRFLEKDVEGILSIGETDNLEERRKKFFRAIQNPNVKHSEGKLWHLIRQHSRLLNIHSKHELEFRFCKKEDKTAAKQSEEELIKTDVRKFGEPPPLNCTIPNRHANWWNINLFYSLILIQTYKRQSGSRINSVERVFEHRHESFGFHVISA